MAFKTAIATLVLRIVALICLAGSVAIFTTDRYTTTIGGSRKTFKSVQAYKYVVSAALLGFIYSLLQLPIAMYHVAKEKILIECLPVFDFYADQLIAYVLATAVGSGFGVSVEYKKILPDLIDLLKQAGAEGLDADQDKRKIDKFLDIGNIASGVLLLGFICVALQALVSSLNRISKFSTSSRKGFFG